MTTNLARSVLAVGVRPLPPSTPELDVCAAPNAQEAFAMLRLLHFDLLLAGREIPDQSPWLFIQRVLLAWPHQRWVFVARGVTFEEEIRARSLGSSLIVETVADRDRLCQIVESLPGRKLSPVAS
jgi:DNA-binding NarL/FixJ family response regulator